MMMHNDAQWFKMQEGGLLNFSGPGEGFEKMVRRKLAFEAKHKNKFQESCQICKIQPFYKICLMFKIC